MQYTSLAHWNTVSGNMNSFLVVSCLLEALAVVSAYGPPALGLVPITTIDHIPNPGYSFNYAVNDPHTGDNKAQWESRHGDVVKGAYSLVEPDGNIRLVEYTADPYHGFNAVVKRTGPNIHSVAPIAHGPIIAPIDPIGHMNSIGPIGHMDSIGPISHMNSIGPIGPIPLAPSPLHTQVITPVIDAPVIAPIPAVDWLPSWPLPAPEPWVSLSGTSYGHKGNIVRRWTAGPISLNGKTLTIKTKH